MRRALITGGCGFVGRHLTQRLIREAYDVTVVDDLSTGLPPERWPVHVRPEVDFQFIQADARRYFQECDRSFDLIAHLAAVVGGRMTIERDPLRVATDLAIDATFFNWLPGLKPVPERILFFSSSAAYPIDLQTRSSPRLLSEEMIDFAKSLGVPDMTYGWSKLTGEFLAKQSVEKYALPVVSYRPFSGYGEDQDLSYPFPSIVKRVVDRESPLIVWGSGEQQRDFIHIDDVVEAVLASKDLLEPGDSLNLASGRGTSFFELAKLCLEVSGHRAEIRNDPACPEGVFARVGDPTRMSRFYTPRVSLEEGVRRGIEYFSWRNSAS